MLCCTASNPLVFRSGPVLCHPCTALHCTLNTCPEPARWAHRSLALSLRDILVHVRRCGAPSVVGHPRLEPPGRSPPPTSPLPTGQVVIHAGDRPREVLHPGSTLGLSQMLTRQPLPLDASIDPNFEARVASLTAVSYQAAARGWAASWVAALAPELPAPARETLRAAVARRARYVRLEAGEPLTVAGEDAGDLVLLVKVGSTSQGTG